jgi:carbonic anhydrase
MSSLPGPEALDLLQRLLVHQFSLKDQKKHHPAYIARLERGGQDPSLQIVECADSYCVGGFDALGCQAEPNVEFTGDNPGNALMTRVYDSRIGEYVVTGTPSTSYFVPHIASHGSRGNYLLITEGHTLCGMVDVVINNAHLKEEPSLYEHGQFMREYLSEALQKMADLDISDPRLRNAFIAQANVDEQVRMASQHYEPKHPGLISSGKLIVLGTMRDITGKIYLPEGRIGAVYITNVNGITDIKEITSFLSDNLKCVSPEVISHGVRRIYTP